MKALKRIIVLLLVVFIIIQFFHPKKNLATGPDSYQHDISKSFAIPDSVQKTFQVACYDCHSNNTVYPWYFKVQPVAWWMDDHIHDGKRALNFSEYETYDSVKQYKKLRKAVKALTEGWMPLSSYTWIHKNAILTKTQKDQVSKWAAPILDSLLKKLPGGPPPEEEEEEN
jgi:hypothetical protein